MSNTNPLEIPGSLKNISRALARKESGEMLDEFRVLENACPKEKQEWIILLLKKFEYKKLSREDKGYIRKYILQVTGYSRAQSTRLITSSLLAIEESTVTKPKAISSVKAAAVQIVSNSKRQEIEIPLVDFELPKSLKEISSALECNEGDELSDLFQLS
ncbi:hypothetical protein HOC67_00920, partial [Candidatus Peregrinibacteria bacterium]|nr:hypothetical protein [Candidatus Peregrinibacteria bacterium]